MAWSDPLRGALRRWAPGAARSLGAVLGFAPRSTAGADARSAPARVVPWPGAEPDRSWAGRASNRPVRWARRRLPWIAGCYALIVAIAAAGAVFNESERLVGGVAFLLLLPLVAGVALAARRSLDGWRLVTLWLLVVPFLVGPPAGQVPPLEPWEWCLWLPVLLFVGLGRSGREVFTVGVLNAVVLGALASLTPWPVRPGGLGAAIVIMVIPLVVGASVGARLSSQRALAEEQARVAAARAEQGALAERARIAREMHDVVAHHMSMIAVRCETAPYRLPALNDAGQQEIAEIGAAARAAMTDMQGLLGVLRAGETDPTPRAELAPQPSLSEVAALVEQARAAGLALHASVDDGLVAAGDAVPEGIGLTLYRIVQEALTNARRHSPGAEATLLLRRAGGGVELVVRSAPVAGAPPAPPEGAAGTPSAGGHGLAGMRERAALHGGELAAGSDPDGGFTVRATLPLPRRGTA